jgi:hypothetical protein
VDRNARQRHAPSIYEKQTFFGQLEHIFVVHIPPDPILKINEPTTVFLAALHPCQLIATPSRLSALDIHFSSGTSHTLDVVDIICLQCLVGRVPLEGSSQWAIIDRSGNLARAVFDI